MNNIRIRAGARLNFTVYQADESSISATFIAENQINELNIISDTVEYVDGKANFQFDSPDTDIAGVYDYQVNENFSTGSPDIYPNTEDCDGECELPTLEICESLSEGS